MEILRNFALGHARCTHKLSMGENHTKKEHNTSETVVGTLCYHAILLCITLLSYLPFRVLYLLSDILYFPFYYLIRYRRRIVRRNLTESFPEKQHNEIVQIEKRFYHFLIDIALETCKMISISNDEMQRRMTFANTDRVKTLLQEGRSVTAYLGHYCNWEWISSTGLWFPDTIVAQIYRTLSNKTMDKVMRRLRERMTNICVERHDTVRFMATQREKNYPQLIGFIADQSPRRKEAKFFLPFLNHMTPVFTGTEKATKHFDYAAMFIAARRVKRGYYECEFVSLTDTPSALPDYELTRLYFQKLEEEILRQPEYYLWTHNRFKNTHIVQ